MPVAEHVGAYWLRSATGRDARGVAELVDVAYGHYVKRIGRLPGPMTADYAQVIRRAQVRVIELHGTVVGVLVLEVTDEGFEIDNVGLTLPIEGRDWARRCWS
jgi:hypothetical protein